MIDAGLSLEPSRCRLVKQLSSSSPATWDTAAVYRFKREGGVTLRSAPLKKIFGSTFPYDGVADRFPIRTSDVGCVGSFGCGGLSTVWGAAILPYSEADTHDWPLPIGDLAEGYREVARLFTVVSEDDDLQRLLPIDSPTIRVPKSAQSTHLLEHLNCHRDSLRADGVTFGSSRLAFNRCMAGDCRLCGLCMYGCPYDLIYSSQQTLTDLRKNSNFTYEPGWLAERFSESRTEVRLRCRRVDGSGYADFSGDRLFLAAGALHTTRLLVRTLEAFNQPFRFKDSQYFLLPCFTSFRSRGVLKEQLYTLSQLFLEIDDDAVSKHSVHLQVYTYSDLYLQLLRGMLKGLYHVALPVLKTFLEHFVILQGFIHSKESNVIEGSLERTPTGDILELHSLRNIALRQAKDRILRKLHSLHSRTQLLPIDPMFKFASAGRGFHYGGSFAMMKDPHGFASDTLGRPSAFSRVHAVDATILPSVPATTITYSVMANAWRIANTIAE